MQVLPRADIDVFLASEALSETFEDLADDWRMSRINLNLYQGGLPAAANRYSQSPSADLVIVEARAGASDMPAEIEHLAQYCRPETRAIIIGAVNDVRLYRQLVGMGVSDYLVPPFSVDDLLFSLSKALDLNGQGSNERLIAVVGAKGGVGATSVAQALSWKLAFDLRETNLLLDLNGQTGTAGIGLGAEGRQSIEDYLLDPSRIDVEVLRTRAVKITDQLSVIAGGAGSVPSDQFPRDSVDAMIDACSQVCPNLVVDLPTGWPTLSRAVAARADCVILVTTLHLGALRNAKAVVDEIRAVKGERSNIMLVLNRVGQCPKMEIPLEEALQTLALPDATVVADAPLLFHAIDYSGAGFGEDRATEAALRPFTDLAHMVIGQRPAAAKEKAKSRSRLPSLLKLKG